MITMNEHDYKLDILKALAIVLVLLWHLQPVRVELCENASTVAQMGKNALSAIYQRTLVAVPIFYFVSLLLFFRKIDLSSRYILIRLKRLINIFSFWFAVQSVVYFCFVQASSVFDLPLIFSKNNSKLWWVIINGGPSLPFVGGSVFYFIVNLIIIVSLSFYYNKISTKKLDLVLFALLSIYLFVHQFFYVIPYWRIDNFLIYIPMAHFIEKNNFYKNAKQKYLYMSLFLYIFFLFFEIGGHKLFNTSHGDYDVNSMQYGVLTLYLLVCNSHYPKNTYIALLSKYSLGLFALHKYCALIPVLISSALLNNNKLSINIGSVNFQSLYFLTALFTIALTIFAIKWFTISKPLKKYVA